MDSRAKARLEANKRRVQQIGTLLEHEFPEARCALNYETPDQLLFATILSAQCTDVRVNMTTPALFKKYPSSKQMAKAKPEQVAKIIKSINFFNNKAKSLVKASQMIQKDFAGSLPRTIEELTKLPGVGRKTANVVLGDAFNVQLGIVVDTHVKRLTNLIGLADGEDPEKIEAQLMEIVPKELWTKFSHWLILHGRSICIARRPKCAECVIRQYCDYGRKGIVT
ncbi:MAG TPA: endonuclease III [Bdellovibrionota bacterium]|jgi:endonuclease-3